MKAMGDANSVAKTHTPHSPGGGAGRL